MITPKKKMGRPTDYSPELRDEICKRISSGNSVHRVSRQDDMPDRSTIYRWLREKPDFKDQYERALKEREDYHFDEMLDIADLVEDDNVKIQKAKLMIDTRKWVLSRMNPKKYGDKAGDYDADNVESKPKSIVVNVGVQDARRKDS